MRNPPFEWNDPEEQLLRKKYQDHTAQEIGDLLGCSRYAVIRYAKKLKLIKSKRFYERFAGKNLRKGRNTPSKIEVEKIEEEARLAKAEQELPKAHIPLTRKAAQEQGVSYVVFSASDTLPPCPTLLELLEGLSGTPIHRELRNPRI